MKRILIVEDDLMLRNTVIEFLENNGFYCFGAPNIEQAKEILAHVQIDIVITDWNMTEGSGLDLLQYVRKAHGNLPVILIASADEGKKWKDLGFNGYLPKPAKLEKIIETIKKF
ncbi:MAG: response regulator [Candidatus Falkowbacteria bacterium]|nr:response regulator [Candidatus Falkowbacteria bacterium]